MPERPAYLQRLAEFAAQSSLSELISADPPLVLLPVSFNRDHVIRLASHERNRITDIGWKKATGSAERV